MFSQNVTLPEAFEMVSQMNKELKRIQWSILQKNQTFSRKIFFIFSLNTENW